MRFRDGMLRCLMVVALLAAQVAAPLLHTHWAGTPSAHVSLEAHMHLLVDDHQAVEVSAEQASLVPHDKHHSSADAHYMSAHAFTTTQQSLKDYTFTSAGPFIAPILPVVPIMTGLNQKPALAPPMAQAGIDPAFGFDAQAPPLV